MQCPFWKMMARHLDWVCLDASMPGAINANQSFMATAVLVWRHKTLHLPICN